MQGAGQLLRPSRRDVRGIVGCPACGAEQGEPCVGARGRARIANHQERVNFAIRMWPHDDEGSLSSKPTTTVAVSITVGAER